MADKILIEAKKGVRRLNKALSYVDGGYLVLELSEDIGQPYFSLVQIIQIVYGGSLLQDHLILCELPLLQEVQQFGDGWTPQKDILQMVLDLQVCIPKQLIPQILRQLRLHLTLHRQVPKIFLQELILQVIPHLILHIFPDLQVVHIGRVDDEVVLVVVVDCPRPQDDLDDVVHHVSVNHEPETHTEECVDGLLGVVGRDVAVTDGRDGVEAPV